MDKKSEQYWQNYFKNLSNSGTEDYITAGWGSIESMLNRYKLVIKNLDLENDLKLLDVGCGPGNFEQTLEKLAIPLDVNSVDLIEENIETCKNKMMPENFKFSVSDASDLKFENNTFDRAVSMGLLQACDHSPEEILSELARVTKPDGIIIITTSNADFDDNYPIYFLENEKSFSSEFITDVFTDNNIKVDTVTSFSSYEMKTGPVNEYHNLMVKGTKK